VSGVAAGVAEALIWVQDIEEPGGEIVGPERLQQDGNVLDAVGFGRVSGDHEGGETGGELAGFAHQHGTVHAGHGVVGHQRVDIGPAAQDVQRRVAPVG